MPRVVPSQVVSFIASVPTNRDNPGVVKINPHDAASYRSVLNLVEQIPDELLTMEAETYVSLIYAKARIQDMLTTWTSEITARVEPRLFSFSPAENPLALILNALAQCADESPAPGTSELNFITDADLRTDLRNDIGRTNRALANGEWKAATVLAASAVEALLLWAIEQRPQADITNAIGPLIATRALSRQPQSDLNRWDLHEYIEVGAQFGIIKPDTAIQTRLTKDFRNLIHPGRAQRLAQKCDRGTALSAVAGVERVVRDLAAGLSVAGP